MPLFMDEKNYHSYETLLIIDDQYFSLIISWPLDADDKDDAEDQNSELWLCVDQILMRGAGSLSEAQRRRIDFSNLLTSGLNRAYDHAFIRSYNNTFILSYYHCFKQSYFLDLVNSYLLSCIPSHSFDIWTQSSIRSKVLQCVCNHLTIYPTMDIK